MTVIPFQLKPAGLSAVQRAVERMASDMADWVFDVSPAGDTNEDAFVEATHIRRSTTLTAHWAPNHWGVFEVDGAGTASFLLEGKALDDTFRRAVALVG